MIWYPFWKTAGYLPCLALLSLASPRRSGSEQRTTIAVQADGSPGQRERAVMDKFLGEKPRGLASCM